MYVTYQQLDWLTMESDLTLSAADSPAKTLALPEKAQDLPVSDQDSGGNTTASSRKRGRPGSLQKMSRPYAIEDWMKFSAAYLRSGTTQNGIVYPLQPLAPLTVETESGLWPTPTANPSNACSLDAGLKEAERLHPQGRWTLWSQVAAQEVYGRRMWPTPDASPHKYRLQGNTQQSKSLNGIHGGKLNPQWVEWLMGFPIGWTDLKHSGTR
jgi:hypothetical protein